MHVHIARIVHTGRAKLNTVAKAFPQQRQIKEDTNYPIKVIHGASRMHTAAEERNATLIADRYAHGRRPQIRIMFESYCRDRARALGYVRLLGRHKTLDCPTPEQAERAIRIISAIVESLDSKWLAE